MAGRPLLAIVLAALVLLAAGAPAEAHRLRVFATVEGGDVTGYGFFIGGGRPNGATVWAETADGTEIFRGETDAEGRFAFTLPAPADLTISLDVGDGHVATTRIPADRFGQPAGSDPTRSAPPPDTATPPLRLTAADAGWPETPGENVTVSREALRELIDRSVDAAVARQIRPLLESYAAAENRLRFNDIAGGIGMIVGLAGIALWISARNRAKSGPDASGGTE